MSSPSIYLDHAATTPIDPVVIEAMLPWLAEHFGNPSSLHQRGYFVKNAVEGAREQITQSLGASKKDSIIFTSGATEANNLALWGVAQAIQQQDPQGKHHLITSAIEHSAVLEPCRAIANHLGWELTILPVSNEGFVAPDNLFKALRPGETKLVSIMAANNEMGALQPIETLGALCREAEVLFHTDAVQWVGKLPLHLEDLPIDYLSLSGHKLYGPKGIGALYIHPNAPKPMARQWGGGQEWGIRPGTENVPGIIGLAKALEISLEKMETEVPRLRSLQGFMLKEVQKRFPNWAKLNGPSDLSKRLPGNLHFSWVNRDDHAIEGERLILQLDLAGIAVSSGSACHSGSIEPSHVIIALGKGEKAARSTLRLSLGRHTTEKELQTTLDALERIIQRLAPTVQESPKSLTAPGTMPAPSSTERVSQ